MQRPLFARSGPLTSDDLVNRARAGDPTALAGLYDLHADTLFRAAFRLTGSRFDAEDAVHDLFVGLPEALRHYDDRGRLGAWLTRVVVRLALMRLRADRRRRVYSLDETPDLIERGDATCDSDINAVQMAVTALPEKLRPVFVLKQVEGYSHEQISSLLGISVGASRVRLARALKTLRHSLR
jgi:RNA polymerase sigma-70 factor (ECF subfamily)